MLKICFVIVVIITLCYSAKILVIFAFPSRSHNILGVSLSKGLAEAGFHVTMLSPYKQNEGVENLTNIYLSGLEENFINEVIIKNNINLYKINAVGQALLVHNTGPFVVNFTLSHPALKEMLATKPKFDAVIVEQFCSDGLKYLSYYFDAPLILLSSMGSNKWVNRFVGNSEPPSYVPNLHLEYKNEMDFYQRGFNFFFGIFITISMHLYALQSQEKIVKKHFPKSLNLEDILYNVSLVLVNGHESFVEPIPSVPNMISIGGYHINPPKKLPDHLHNFIENAVEGVIYFSMGTVLVPSQMANRTFKTILKTLGNRKERIIFKWDREEDGKISSEFPNVMFLKWLPQQDLLAHVNVKLFITHGGLLSISEAICFGVPILVLPVFGDQQTNALRVAKWGMGRRINFSNLTENNFKTTLDDLMSNHKYKANAVLRSKLFHDRPIPPMDLAVYWVRYAIRHKGATHLRVEAINLKWYQYHMLDVLALSMTMVFLIIYISYKIIAYLCLLLRSKTKIKQN